MPAPAVLKLAHGRWPDVGKRAAQSPAAMGYLLISSRRLSHHQRRRGGEGGVQWTSRIQRATAPLRYRCGCWRCGQIHRCAHPHAAGPCVFPRGSSVPSPTSASQASPSPPLRPPRPPFFLAARQADSDGPRSSLSDPNSRTRGLAVGRAQLRHPMPLGLHTPAWRQPSPTFRSAGNRLHGFPVAAPIASSPRCWPPLFWWRPPAAGCLPTRQGGARIGRRCHG